MKHHIDTCGPAAGGPVDNAMVSLDGTVSQVPALVGPERWNGWVVPAFTREAAEVVVAALNATYARFDGDACDRAEWDDDVVVVHSPEYEDEPGYRPERVVPDEHGRYRIGARCYTWSFANLQAPHLTAFAGTTGAGHAPRDGRVKS